ncbi:MAG: GNAT family N-acetyltransferase [Clostridium sp.]|nr:GNAT family N-acetyltransferase [Clostridium sp.]
MELRLVKPSIEMENEYLSYIKEWEESGEKIVPYASRRNGNQYKDLLRYWAEEETDIVRKKDKVPASLYFLVDEKGKIYGALGLRYELNDFLLKIGGHIGYGIRPSERKKGYATKMLSLALPIAKKLGITKVLITCDKSNLGSAGTIKNNGGILENVFIEEDGNIVERYWINL